jgi:hypothetical protein
MTKHVFQFSYGSLSHIGELVQETEKTYQYLYGRRKTYCVKGRDKFLVETDDPDETLKSFKEAVKHYDDEIRDLEKKVWDLKQRRREVGLSTIGVSL